MGPVEPAHKAILGALERGKSVVTANKALLAQSTGELAQAAERAHVDLYFEAAVAGAIPVIRPLTQSLAGDTVLRVAGIVNGTTNYILSEMASTGADYDRRAGRRQHARLRRGRPDRRCRGLRRRGQGRDPGVDRVSHPGSCRRRVPGGHHQGHAGRLRLGPGAGLHHQAAFHLRADHQRRRTGTGFGAGVSGAGAAGASAGGRHGAFNAVAWRPPRRAG